MNSTTRPASEAVADLRVLVVDDDAFQLRLLGLLLHQIGFHQPQTVDSGREALNRLDKAPVDLLICDLQMPDLDGVELLRHLAARDFQGQIVCISGEDARLRRSVERLGRAHGLRMLGSLPKPIGLADLHALLQSRPRQKELAEPAALPTPSAAELRHALASGQLRAHYQPKVEMATGRWVGVEALARWAHPEHGLLPPSTFVPLAERHGLADALTDTLLGEADSAHGVLAQMRRWLDSGRKLQTAVNISMLTLHDAQLPDRLHQLLQQAGVPPSHLILEVTESCLMEDARTSIDILTRMRLKRIGLAIDDFGTGHSSLAQLRDVPFGELKVDGSFVHRAHAHPELQALLRASLQMGHQLGMKTVAEGVEDRADWDYARAQGADIAQGYFIARPMPADELPAWLHEWETRLVQLVD